MLFKDADGMANSEDPDQTAPSASKFGSGLTVPIFRILWATLRSIILILHYRITSIRYISDQDAV